MKRKEYSGKLHLDCSGIPSKYKVFRQHLRIFWNVSDIFCVWLLW